MNRNTKVAGSVFSAAALSTFIYYNGFYVDSVHQGLVSSNANYVAIASDNNTEAQNELLTIRVAESACEAKDIQSIFVAGDMTELEEEMDTAFDILEVQVSQRDSFCSTFLANLDHT